MELPSTITHAMCVVPPQKQLETMAKLARFEKARCLVFVSSPYRAKIVCGILADTYNLEVVSLIGEQDRQERAAIMRCLNDGTIRTAVTTEMGARGLDIPGLTHVVNLDMPTDHIHYVHRAGRCGRAGAAGTMLSIVPPNRVFVARKLTKLLDVPLNNVEVRGGALVESQFKETKGRKAVDRQGSGSGPSRSAPAAADSYRYSGDQDRNYATRERDGSRNRGRKAAARLWNDPSAELPVGASASRKQRPASASRKQRPKAR